MGCNLNYTTSIEVGEITYLSIDPDFLGHASTWWLLVFGNDRYLLSYSHSDNAQLVGCWLTSKSSPKKVKLLMVQKSGKLTPVEVGS